MHFARLVDTLLEDEESARDSHVQRTQTSERATSAAAAMQPNAYNNIIAFL